MSEDQLDFARALRTIGPGNDGRAWAQFAGHRLTSHFQPIVSLSHRRVIGHEGLLRAFADGGGPVSPLDVLGAARRDGELVCLDRVARLLHVLNRPAGEAQWLFLNMHPEVFVEAASREAGSFMTGLLDHGRIDAAELVIEVLEDTIRDEARFAETVARLRDQGFLIALDDFGAGHSNFDRVWTVRPEIVKLDRSFAQRVEHDPAARRLLPRIVTLLHEAGSLVLLEGVETAGQARIALDSDVDFVQGYHFARPSAVPAEGAAIEAGVDALWQDFAEREASSADHYRARIAPYQNALGYASVLLAADHSLAEACAGFLALPGAQFCYLLDRGGRQVGHNLAGPMADAAGDPRFLPLADASQARWSRRPYFRRAAGQFGRVQVTRPYLSAATAGLCVTLSVSFHRGEETLILCGDVTWE